MLQLKNGSIYQYHTFLKHLYGTYAIADQFCTICSNQKALQQPAKVCSNPPKKTHFEAKGQLLHKKKQWNSNPMASSAFRLLSNIC